MMMHVMVAAKHDASAYFLSSAAVKQRRSCPALRPAIFAAPWLWGVQL